MRRVYREILERDVFNLTIEELEEGERPGWVERCIIVIEGDYMTMRFDVHWNVTRFEAMVKVVKMQIRIWTKQLRKK